MQTLNQHISLLRNYASNHFQINDFGVGETWELVESFVNDDGSMNNDRQYPVMWVTIGESSVNEFELVDSYTVYFCDRVLKSEKNETEVLSDMKLLCTDLMAYLRNSANVPSEITPVLSFSMSPFTERFQDEVSGWELSVQIKQSFKYNACAIPMDDAPTDQISCQPVTITDGGDTVEVASGGSYTCVNGGSSGGTINVYVDGVLFDTIVTADFNTETINIDY